MQLGNYQSDIKSLSSLSITAYERIFKLYTTEKNTKEFLFYNILKKIEIPDTIDDELVSFYNVKSDMPLTILSYKIYGDMKLWWLLFLINKKTLETNRFVVSGGVQIEYIKPEYLSLVLSQITKITQGNGKHFN
jgi:hypothetical protein